MSFSTKPFYMMNNAGDEYVNWILKPYTDTEFKHTREFPSQSIHNVSGNPAEKRKTRDHLKVMIIKK